MNKDRQTEVCCNGRNISQAPVVFRCSFASRLFCYFACCLLLEFAFSPMFAPESKEIPAFPSSLILLYVCLCLFTFVFNALHRRSKGFVSKKKINIICYACLPPALAGKVQLLLNSLRSWAGLLQAGKMTKCSKHRLDQAVRLSVRRRNASGTVGGSRSTIA